MSELQNAVAGIHVKIKPGEAGRSLMEHTETGYLGAGIGWLALQRVPARSTNTASTCH